MELQFINKCGETKIIHKDYSKGLSDDLEELFTTYQDRNEKNLIILKDESVAENARSLNSALDSYFQEMGRVLEDENTVSQESFELIHMKTKTKAVKEVILKIAIYNINKLFQF